MRIGKKGFTLVEVIVSLAIMTIVAGSVGAFIIAGNNSYLRGNKELTLQEEAQLAANQMIDLIIDVEKDINFTPDHADTAVDLDGNTPSFPQALRSGCHPTSADCTADAPAQSPGCHIPWRAFHSR